jgi:hypothetical protein
VTNDREPPSNEQGEPTIVSHVRKIRQTTHLPDANNSVEVLGALLQWLDQRRMLDEDGVVVWSDEPNARVVAEGPGRLVKTTGHYTATEAPTSHEIPASELFVTLGATLLGVVRQIQADLPNSAPRDVAGSLAALERLLSG